MEIYFVYYQERCISFFKKMVFSFGWNIKDDLLKKYVLNMTFLVWSLKMIFLFPVNLILHFAKKMIHYQTVFAWVVSGSWQRKEK